MGCVVVLGTELVPQLGILRDIVVFDTDVFYFVLETIFFSHHYHAFQVQEQNCTPFHILKQRDLYDHTVLAAYTLQGHPHVMMFH
jgi:hypothetical protein